MNIGMDSLSKGIRERYSNFKQDICSSETYDAMTIDCNNRSKSIKDAIDEIKTYQGLGLNK